MLANPAKKNAPALAALVLALASLGGCTAGSAPPFFVECEAAGHSYEECERVAETHWDLEEQNEVDSLEYSSTSSALTDPNPCVGCHQGSPGPSSAFAVE